MGHCPGKPESDTSSTGVERVRVPRGLGCEQHQVRCGVEVTVERAVAARTHPRPHAEWFVPVSATAHATGLGRRVEPVGNNQRPPGIGNLVGEHVAKHRPPRDIHRG